jgi:hypothetical protein
MEPVTPADASINRPGRLMRAAIEALGSWLRRKPGDDRPYARPLGYYLRQAIHDRIDQALPPPSVVDL